MNSLDKKYHFVIPIVALYLTSLFVYFFSPTWITSLFQNNQFDLLNALAQVNANQVLDYYLGTIEENITGPLRFFLSGSAFLLFTLIFLTKSSCRVFTGALFVYFLLSRPEILLAPPYGDPISGPWAEALWLAKNNFDYVGLYHQPEYAAGGPKVYLFTLYPTYLALLLKLIPSTKIFLLVNHLLVFLMAATTVSLFREVARKIFKDPSATLVSLLLLFLPLFQAGSELLNMEMPNTFFAICCFHALTHQRFGRAFLFALLSTLMKAPGLIAALTVAVAAFVWAVFHREGRIKNIIFSFLSGGFAYGFVYIKKFVNADPLSHNAIEFMAGWSHIQHCPVIMGLTALSFLTLAVFLCIRRDRGVMERFWAPFLSLTLVLGWLALYLNFSVLGPRYKLILSPFLLFSSCYSVWLLLRKEKVFQYSCVVLCGFLMLCVFGGHYNERIESKYYAYGRTERSLEYRADLKLYQKMAHTLSKDFEDFTVGVPFILAQSLAFPELGYVEKPLKVVVYGMSIFYSDHIKNFNHLKNMEYRHTVWVGFLSDVDLGFPYPISKKDQIVEIITVGNKKATLFYGGVAIDKMYKTLLLRRSGRNDWIDRL